MLIRLLSVFLAATALAFAASDPATDSVPFTARELAQGYREHVLLARPHARSRATADADEAREGVRVREKFSRMGDLRVIELDDTDAADRALARLQATGRYEFVERDLIRHLDATPNDPSFSTLWGLNNNGGSGGVAGADIKAIAAWDIIHDAPNVIVAVVDTGLNLTHQDIAANLWRNPSPSARNDINGANFVGGRGSIVSGNPTDDNGHGTHVAGTIGAVGNNGLNVVGVAWKVQIMALKALSSSGTGSVSDLAAAVNYAITHGASIINASYGESGGNGFSQTELAALTAARDAGVIFVAAAGNDAADMDISPHYPASHALDNIVSVGSSQRNDFVSTFSNYGAAIDLFAPGESILSLLYSSNTGTQTLNGTSMATPHVAGALALLKAQFPTDTYRQLINRLLRGVDPGSRFTGKAQSNGRLNLFNSLTTTANRPFNDEFANRARLVGDNFLIRSSNTGATSDAGEPAHAGFPGGVSLWWEWTPSTTEAVRVTTSGSTYDTLLAIYTGTSPSALTLVAANDNDGANPTSRIDFTAQAGVTYEIAVDGKNGATGLTLLNLGSVPANDAFATPVTLTGSSDTVTATNANCTRETGEPRILIYPGGTSLWYQWTAPKSGRFQVAVTSNDFDPLLAVYTGTALNALTPVTANDNIATSTSSGDTVSTSSLCTFNATAGTTYRITVDAKSNVGQFVLTLNDSIWQTATTASVTGAASIASDGTVYVGSTDLSLYAYAPDGTPKAGFPVATNGLIDTCSPAIGADGTVYFGSTDGFLYASNPDGSPKWSRSFNTGTGTSAVVNGAGNSPAIGSDGTIYIKISDGYLHAINPADGSDKWKANVNAPLSTFYGSPVVGADGTIYQGSDENDSTLYAINPDSTQKWSFKADSGIYATPAIDAAGNIYFCTLTGGVYSVTSAGTLRWRVFSGGNISSSPAISADGSTFYYGGYDKVLYARLTATGAVRWTFTLPNEVRASSPAIDANGVIYIGCYDQKIYAVNSNGTLNHTWATGVFVRSCPTIFGNTLYCGSNDGKLYAFDLGVGVAGGPWPQYRANARHLGRAVSEAFAITAAPQSQTAVIGQPVTLSVVATGPSAINYQWSKDGATIAGATSASYTVPTVTTATAGTYTVSVTSAQGTLTSTPAVVIVEPANPGRLTNLSVRTNAGTGAQTLIVGFNVAGSPDKAILIRAIGPSLTQFGVTGVLADPQLQLFSGTTQLTANDNWGATTGGSAALASAFSAVGAFPLDASSLDAALVRTMSPGGYTAQVTSAGATGIVLAELYDTTPAAGARLTNVSARAQVGTGSGILIAGFSINGNVAKKILIRGVGPSLSQFGVTGRLADPKLQVFDAKQNSVATNDDWGGDATLAATFTSVGAFPMNTFTSLDSALLVTLPPGTYTAQVSGVNSTTGVALVEVYEVP